MKIEISKKDLDNLMLSQIKNPITDETDIWCDIHAIENYVDLYNEFNKLPILHNPASTIFKNLSKLILKNENINILSSTTNSNNTRLDTFTTGMLIMRNYLTKDSKYAENVFMLYIIANKKDAYMFDEILWIVIHGFLGGFMNPSEIANLLETVIFIAPNEFQSNIDTYKGFEICPILKDYITIKNGSCDFIDTYRKFSLEENNITSNDSSTTPQKQPSELTLTGASNMDYPIIPDYSTLPPYFRYNVYRVWDTTKYKPWYDNLVRSS